MLPNLLTIHSGCVALCQGRTPWGIYSLKPWLLLCKCDVIPTGGTVVLPCEVGTNRLHITHTVQVYVSTLQSSPGFPESCLAC